MVRLSKINGFVWVKFFDSTGLVFEAGEYRTISAAMATVYDFLGLKLGDKKNELFSL